MTTDSTSSGAVITRAVTVWIPMVGIAILNGSLRQYVLAPQMSEMQARQLSTMSLLLLFALYIGWTSSRWPLQSASDAWITGAIWLSLTVAFELALGLAGGRPWPAMLADYDLLSGNLWTLVPLSVALAPYVFFRLYRRTPLAPVS